MKPERPRLDERPEQPEPRALEHAPESPAAELDFDALDLSVETVEERISPSETNVFDK